MNIVFTGPPALLKSIDERAAQLGFRGRGEYLKALHAADLAGHFAVPPPTD